MPVVVDDSIPELSITVDLLQCSLCFIIKSAALRPDGNSICRLQLGGGGGVLQVNFCCDNCLLMDLHIAMTTMF